MSAAIDQQLLEAAESGDITACRDLLACGANINAVNKLGCSALHQAAWQGHADICQLLIERGADVDCVTNDGRSVLHWATLTDRTAICVTLLECGCNPLIKAKNGQTAMDVAIERGYEDCTQVIRSWIAANAARAALQEFTAATTPPGP